MCVYRRARRDTAPVPRWNRGRRQGGELRGRTAGSDGSSWSRFNRATREGRRDYGQHPAPWALPGLESNPLLGGTAHQNTGTRPAGGSPPMAGHDCKSVKGSFFFFPQKCWKFIQGPVRTGPLSSPHAQNSSLQRHLAPRRSPPSGQKAPKTLKMSKFVSSSCPLPHPGPGPERA